MTDEVSEPAPPTDNTVVTSVDNLARPPANETQPVTSENVLDSTGDAEEAETKYSMLNPELKAVRRIIADDLEWSLRIVPALTDLALNSLVKSFDTNPKYNELLNKHRHQLLNNLPTNVPLKVTAPLIEDESYWQKCCKEKWPICDIKKYDNSWKRFYFEKHVEEIIENIVPAKDDTKKLFEYINLGMFNRLESKHIDLKMKLKHIFGFSFLIQEHNMLNDSI